MRNEGEWEVTCVHSYSSFDWSVNDEMYKNTPPPLLTFSNPPPYPPFPPPPPPSPPMPLVAPHFSPPTTPLSMTPIGPHIPPPTTISIAPPHSTLFAPPTCNEPPYLNHQNRDINIFSTYI